ncbi:hypothetical protein BO70DRAFT_357929 [Aspergillus heteromorphus CBS 117.55]|uniref:Coenzyme Q-binding protein COQ10 START domain-containing protein n=1 Tax=Aspergillus heteromorphus CBS 117.55 TaxID=1448321 RepID=A0A317X371_9EURO|nr:uncharacterized protein BO70DRAFT_357929 [Aspergillus heteromorphus CBS 117.55]PWY92785.1 hypothetical protein BO70DRAFT_357929 [Aspergillus heteromorphus CBS 117.55]
MPTSRSSKASLASRPTLNIAASDAIVHFQSVTLIDAPVQEVWDALVDTSTWPSWNRFVPRVTIRQQPASDSPSNPSPVLEAGTRMTFHVNMKPTSPQPQPDTDTMLMVAERDAPSASKKLGRIVWVNDAAAQGRVLASLLTAERVHEVSEVEVQDEEGHVKRVTEVRNWEAQIGVLAYVVRWMLGARLDECFDLWVQDLKEYVEKTGARG